MNTSQIMTMVGGSLCAVGIVLYSLRTGRWVYLPGKNAASMNGREFALVLSGMVLLVAAYFT